MTTKPRHPLALAILLLLSTFGCSTGSSERPNPQPETVPATSPSHHAEEEPQAAGNEPASGSPASGSPASETTETRADNWIEQSLQRESEALPPQPLHLPEIGFAAQVGARIDSLPELTEDEETSFYVTKLGLGSESPLTCFLYEYVLDLAQSLVQAMEGSFVDVEARYGEIAMRALSELDTGVIDGSPYLSVEWIYRIESPDGAVLGQFKFHIAAKAGRTLLCAHNELGYSESVKRVFGDLVRSATWEDQPAAPFYTEAYVYEAEGIRTGVVHASYSLDEDGDTVVRESEHVLTPVDESTVVGEDTYEVEFSSPDGSLINAHIISAQRGEIVTELTLERRGNLGWQVSGKFESKEITLQLPAEEPLSGPAQFARVRTFLRDAEVGDKTTMPMWVPSVDPAAMSSLGMEYLGRSGDAYKTRVDVGAQMNALFDASGSMESAVLDAGDATVTVLRVYADGESP